MSRAGDSDDLSTSDDGREADTVLDRPRPAGSSPGETASPSVGRSATVPVPRAARPARAAGLEDLPSRIESPLEALHHDEIARSRRLSAVGLSVAAAIAVWASVLDSPHTWILHLATGAAMVANLLLLYLALDPARYTRVGVAVSWELSSLAIVAGTVYVGVFSPASVVMLLALYFISLGNDLRLALAVYLTFAIPLAAIGTAIIAGWMVDPGMVQATNLGIVARVGIQGLIQLIFVWTFILARWSRQTMLDAVTALGDTARALAKREAHLEEARQDLERALEVGGAGRFTGETMGSYRLGLLIGRGGFGEVYEASHERSGEPAAVKLLRSASLADPLVVKRFAREVEIAAAIKSPHVTRVLEVSDAADPLPYLAMEFLRGEDLSRILRSERQLDPERALDLVHQIGAGLTAAGRLGIIHRDIKPQNLFWSIDADGERRWKILDFGVSKLIDSSASVSVGHLVGTPVYMAPEQARGEPVDPRADIYALSAVAYRALTGMPPFRGGDMPAILYNVVHQMPERPSLLAELPAEIDEVLLIGLAKRPASRFATADQLGEALAAAFAGTLPESTRERARALAESQPWRAPGS